MKGKPLWNTGVDSSLGMINSDCMIKFVVFDFDGTLVESNEIKRQTFFEVTDHLPGTKPLLDKVLSDPEFGDRNAIFAYVSERLNSTNQGVVVDPLELSALYTKLCEEKIIQAHEIKGATQALAKLYAMGIKLMISSATPELTLKNIILKRGWGPMFSDIYGFPASKEQHVTEIMGTWQCSAENILYVGDSEIDRRAALRAGCYFAGVGNDTSRFDIIPEHMLEDLRELPSFVMQHP